MSEQPFKSILLQRDGTSQTGRHLAALDPDYVSVDERSAQDLLAFAREYAKELNYFDEQNQRVGCWGDLLGRGPGENGQPDTHGDLILDLEKVVAFMDDPGKFNPSESPAFFRAHFVLFLTFLKLLRHAQDHLNTLTRRHLDFYYKQVLRMRERPAVPDQVNILFEPASNVSQILLPAGTALSAGPDSQGQDRIYRTDRQIVVNRAQIARVSSVHVHKRITGIREARELETGTSQRGFMAMLKMALGDPMPGDPLPRYSKEQEEVDFEFLQQLAGLLAFTGTEFHMSFFEFGKLMSLKRRRSRPVRPETEWDRINRLLEEAGRKRTGASDWELEARDPKDFDANFKKATGVTPEGVGPEAAGPVPPSIFDGTLEVSDIYDLYDKWSRAFGEDRVALERIVEDKLHFVSFADFKAMSDRKDKIDNEWSQINRILEHAGQKHRKDAFWRLIPEDPQGFDPTKFAENLIEAVAPDFTQQGLEEVQNIDEYYAAVRRLEKYVCMSAENFSYVMSMADSTAEASGEWDKVYGILANAHTEKAYETRRQRLKNRRERQGFEAMIGLALGEDPPQEEPPPLERLQTFVRRSYDSDFLEDVSQKPDADPDWDRVYRIVEIAQRTREGFVAPVARREEWRNLYPAEDARAIVATLGTDSEEDNPRWKTFGQGEHLVDKDSPPPASFGWAISSPLLALSQGVRTITLILGFNPELLFSVDATSQIRQHLDNEEFPEDLHAAFKDNGISLTAAENVDVSVEAEDSKWRATDQELARTYTVIASGDRLSIYRPSPALSDVAKKAELPFRIEVSTEKGWIEPTSTEVEVDSDDYQSLTEISDDIPEALEALKFEVTFQADVDPIAPLPTEEADIAARWPLLRLTLRQKWQAKDASDTTGTYTTDYEPFRELTLARVYMKVDVSGLTPLQIQNDETVLDANKPFEPFGINPSAGSRFFLGHPELVFKRLESLTFDIDWMGVPKILSAHYANYHAVTDAGSFTMKTSLIDNRLDLSLAAKDPLFSLLEFELEGMGPDALTAGDISVELRGILEAKGIVLSEKATVEGEEPPWAIIGVEQGNSAVVELEDRKLRVYTPITLPTHTLHTADVPNAIKTGSAHGYERATEAVFGEDLLTWSRYLQWELNPPDFQHGTYPTLAVQKSVALAAAASTGDGVPVDQVPGFQVNPPYTPKMQGLSLAYTSSEEIVIGKYRPGSQIDRIFHIHPFGYNEVQPENGATACPWLPQYNNEGELYIGIKDLQPRQNLSILFQMAEGSADPELESASIQWSYLSGNRWMSLHEGNILHDSTRGLINSGIITFDLESVEPSTLLPEELYWLRAAVAQNANSVCDAIALHPQAVSATFVPQNNAPDHYCCPLPAESISELVEPMPEITAVQQPYTSYGAKAKEEDRIFYTRVSERLRHKGRALTLWDYERLILDEFPQIYKAKCLSADTRGQSAEPGQVEIIVISNIRGQLPRDPFKPRVSAKLIADIEIYLADRCPAWATIKVRNASYIEVKVRVWLRFKQGCDEGFCKAQLNDQLNRFLSPWAYEQGADIVIGSRIYANSIVNFIDERDYVDYVAEIKLFTTEDGGDFEPVEPTESQGYFVTTDKPDAVLVAARDHEIDIVSEVGHEPEEFMGINHMIIGLDFIVG